MDNGYAVGDRVRTTKPLHHIAADRLGTIVRIFARGFYGVQIDGELVARILAEDHIAPMPHPQKDKQPRMR